MYFTKFDKIQYNGKTAVNITNSILLKYKTITNTTLYQYHTVIEGETAISLAHKYYGNAKDSWIILLLNNIVDPFFDWVLTSREIAALVAVKYGEGLGDRIHHLFDINKSKQLDDVDQAKYINTEGQLILSLPVFIHPVSNAEYETTQNNERREIKILSPTYIQDFKNDFEDLMNREGLS